MTIILLIISILAAITIFSFILIKITFIIIITTIGATYIGTYLILNETLNTSTEATIAGAAIIGTLLIIIIFRLLNDTKSINKFQLPSSKKKAWEKIIRESNETTITRIKKK